MTANSEGTHFEHRIFLNGNVITMDAGDSLVEAVAIRNGSIEAVGGTDEIRKLITAESEVIDLEGKTMIPGFIEAHGHFPGSGLNALGVNLNSPPIGQFTSIPQVIEALKKKAFETEKGKWILGFGYDDTNLKESRLLSRHDLDEVSKDHPICVFHISLHLSMVNSLGLKEIGCDKETPDPEGGVIRRDPETGEPSGELEEEAVNLVRLKVMDFTLEESMMMIQWSSHDYISNGVTTAQCGYADEKLLTGLSMASQFQQIPIRVMAWPDAEMSEKIIHGEFDTKPHETEMFMIGAAKIIGDGSIQGYTANLSKPYHLPFEGDKEYKGYPGTSREEMAKLVKKFHKAGMQVAIHGNGDATIDDIIHSIAEAQKESPRPDARHIIIHAQTSRLDQLEEMKKLGITPSFFSAHTYYWGDRHYDIFLGPERASFISPAKTAGDKGIRYTIHLDTPVVPMNPLLLVWTAVNRVSTSGRIIGEDERISPLQALKATTIDAAWQIFKENIIGSIEVGKHADLVILSDDPLKDPTVIKDLEVLETIVGGKTVYFR
ncbi:amidohydrolase [bacterium]|nr:amidohydrolase [bacterium]